MVGSYGFGIDNVNGLTFDPNTNTLFGSGNFFYSDELLIIDTMTGAATLVGPLGFDGVQGLALAPSGVPESSSIAIMFGIAVFGFSRRDRRSIA